MRSIAWSSLKRIVGLKCHIRLDNRRWNLDAILSLRNINVRQVIIVEKIRRHVIYILCTWLYVAFNYPLGVDRMTIFGDLKKLVIKRWLIAGAGTS